MTPVTTIKNPEQAPHAKGVHSCPGPVGGVEWNGPAYDQANETDRGGRCRLVCNHQVRRGRASSLVSSCSAGVGSMMRVADGLGDRRRSGFRRRALEVSRRRARGRWLSLRLRAA